jgi:ABC-2 type transport system permease protein
MGLTLFFSFAVMAGSIGMIIQAQDEIIQEKQSGTAAWILSKPVARQSFVLTKMLSNIIGGLIFIVALPALVALGEIFLAVGHITPIIPYLAGAGVVLLALIFYLSLVIMLGILFDQRGPVLGVAFGVMFGGLIAVQFAPQVNYFLPVSMDKIALALSQGQALPAVAISQLIATAAWSILFTVVALWRFQRTEF